MPDRHRLLYGDWQIGQDEGGNVALDIETQPSRPELGRGTGRSWLWRQGAGGTVRGAGVAIFQQFMALDIVDREVLAGQKAAEIRAGMGVVRHSDSEPSLADLHIATIRAQAYNRGARYREILEDDERKKTVWERLLEDD